MQSKASIYVTTYNRVHLVKRLLQKMQEQVLKNDISAIASVNLVDNSPDGNAQKIFNEFEKSSNKNITFKYHNVVTPGIGNVRNYILDLHRNDKQWVIMFDDDQIPSHDWLYTYLKEITQQNYPADVYIGLAIPRMPYQPSWAKNDYFWGGYSTFSTSIIKNGQAAAANSMYSPNITNNPNLRVEKEYLLGPSEDFSLYRKVTNWGYVVRHFGYSRAYAEIPTRRLTQEYLLKRHYDHGVSLGKFNANYTYLILKELKSSAELLRYQTYYRIHPNEVNLFYVKYQKALVAGLKEAIKRHIKKEHINEERWAIP